MKGLAFLAVGALSAGCFTGCARFEYRLVEPAASAARIGDAPLTVPYAPLEYGVTGRGDHLVVRVVNPTERAVSLVASRSYVIDPRGESHPVRGHVIGPHSHVWLGLPPPRTTVSGYGMVAYWGYAPYGWSGSPYWPAYDWPYPPIYSYSYQLHTPYDWHWRTGRVRLHLGYDSAGTNLEQELVFERERVKR